MTVDLTAKKIDQAIGKKARVSVIWTASAIADRIGTSPDFVRDKLALEPDSPVKKIGGRWCAREDELLAYFQNTPKKPSLA